MDALALPGTRNLEKEWADCERQLHATAMPDVQRYQADLRALRAEADRLADDHTINALVERWTSLRPDETDHRAMLVRGAAFALRASQIRAASDARRVLERITLAREAGQTWAVLQDTGTADREQSAEFSVTTMHLQSGFAILSMGQYAPMNAKITYALAVIRLAPDTGTLIEATPGLADWLETSSRAEHEASVETWRGRIEAGIEQG